MRRLDMRQFMVRSRSRSPIVNPISSTLVLAQIGIGHRIENPSGVFKSAEIEVVQ